MSLETRVAAREEMSRRARVLVTGLLMGSLVACGGESVAVDETRATVTTVRGALSAAAEATEDASSRRLTVGDEVTVAGLAWFTLDSGPAVLIKDGGLTLSEEDARDVVTVTGRAFADVPLGDTLILIAGEHRFRVADAAVSIDLESGSAYVVRGEVPFSTTGAEARQGRVRAGEQLPFGEAEASAATLWRDWTGGLARPGPVASVSRGVGALEGRVPDARGQARWPLVIRRLDVNVRFDGELAITEVEQEFFNPASEVVEGLYRLAVPERAMLQRFAVDRDGRLVDGYIREKAQARQAYQRQVYRGSTLDPALLEWDAPGRFRARIYPIQPGATRTIAIRYTEWVGSSAEARRRYRFPMGSGAAAPHVQEFAFTADLSGASFSSVRAGHGAEVDGDRVVVRRSDFRPRQDLFLELFASDEETAGQYAFQADHVAPARDPRRGAMVAEDDDDYFYVPLMLPDAIFDEVARDQGLDVVLVVDVSAGTDRSHLELGRAVSESIAAHLREGDRVAIVASDVALRDLGDQALGDVSPERVASLLDGLARAPAGGATDLGASLVAAASLLEVGRPSAVVYIGDGAPTVGELGAEGLLTRLSRLPHPTRFYGVAVGTHAELGLLESISRGGGLAMRVETRSEAAHVALRLLSHAQRGVAQQITVDLGTGIERVFPREAIDVVRGQVLDVIGRVHDDVPSEITVRGSIGGEEFERKIALRVKNVNDDGDLRLRWAGERLRALLLSSAGRAEIADLGVRSGLITPYTSFYVPSAAELTDLGPRGRELYRDLRGFTREDDALALLNVLTPSALATALPGCFSMDKSAPSGSAEPSFEEELEEAPVTVAEMDEGGEGLPSSASTTAPVAPVAADPSPSPSERSRDESGVVTGALPPNEQTVAQGNRYALNGPSDGFDDMDAEDRALMRGDGDMAEAAEEVAAEPEPEVMDQLAQLGYMDIPNQQPAADRAAAAGVMGLDGHGRGGGGSANGYGGLGMRGSSMESAQRTRRRRQRRRPSPMIQRIENMGGESRREGRLSGGSVSGVVSTITTTTTTRVSVRTQPSQLHYARRCSDAADRLLDTRRALWRERLANASGVHAWVAQYSTAARNCELPTWRARRAFLNLLLAKAGNVRGMVNVYNAFRSPSLRRYLRRATIRRVRTPDDLRIARQAFGSAHISQESLIAQVLERAQTPAQKIRALRRLSQEYPSARTLKLRLLELLEREGKIPEARRLAQRLRKDAMTDAEARTAIGEMYLRLEDEAEARRVFSEIVEFAPRDELARRRLGDLYRAHAWFDDAYRQYQTLAEIRPDDPSVFLLLAQAAAGAGRVDEALRLERRLSETAQPGDAVGVARTALLWSSVRFATLRKAARDANDDEKLNAVLSEMRRSGVLRASAGLRVALVWAHPDAGVSLWTGTPRTSSVMRPTDIAPEYNIEVFDVDEQESGRYPIEVRRPGDHLTEVNAKLVVIFGEGRADEHIEVRELTFGRGDQKFAFEINGRDMNEVRR